MVPYIVWNDYYSVGEPTLDAQHKEIIFLVNEMYSAMQEAAASKVLSAVLERLIQYTMIHFQHEEDVMQAHDFPGLAEHKRQHDKMRLKILAMQEDLKTVMSQDLLQFLKQRWINHIQGEDKKYAPYLELTVNRC